MAARSTAGPPIAVLGATGRVGGSVLRQLSAAGQPVRALVRDPGRLAAECETAVVDLRRPETIGPALDGCERAFLAMADAPDQTDLELAFVRAAKDAGVRRLVKLSAQSAGLDPPVSVGRWHRPVEEAIEGSRIDYTILRPTFFMQTFLQFASDIAAKGKFVAPCKRGKVAFVDVDDVAAVAASVLASGDHAGAILTLTGPEAITFAEAGDRIGAATGRSVKHVAPPRPVARLVMPFVSGMPRWLVAQVIDLLAALDRGAQSTVTPDIETVLGRPASSFADFAERHKADFS